MDVVRFSKSYQASWNAAIKASTAASFIFHRDFMEYHQERFDDFSLLFCKQQEIVAIFPASYSGTTVCSHGGLSYGGMVLTPKRAMAEVLQAFQLLLTHYQTQGFERLVYKQLPTYYHTSPTFHELYPLHGVNARLQTRELNMLIDLQRPFTIQQRRIRGAKKALQAGWKWGKSDDWASFWEVLESMLQSRYRKSPVHSSLEIERLQQNFPEHIQLFTVHDQHEVVAGTVLFINATTVHAQYIAASPKGKDVGALDLLFKGLLEKFSDYRYFSLGVSNTRDGLEINQGLYEWKASWGAIPWPHDIYEINLKQDIELTSVFKNVH